jgi:hypothetical protein
MENGQELILINIKEIREGRLLKIESQIKVSNLSRICSTAAAAKALALTADDLSGQHKIPCMTLADFFF